MTTLSNATPVMDGLYGDGPLPSAATWNAMMKSVESKAKRPRKKRKPRKPKKSSRLLLTKDQYTKGGKTWMSLEDVVENLPLAVLQKTAPVTKQTSLGSFVRKIGRATQKVMGRMKNAAPKRVPRRAGHKRLKRQFD